MTTSPGHSSRAFRISIEFVLLPVASSGPLRSSLELKIQLEGTEAEAAGRRVH